MPIDQEQLKQQIYNYLESLNKMMPIEDVDFNVLVHCLYQRAQVLELDVVALRRVIADILAAVFQIHGHWSSLIGLLEHGVSIYDEQIDTLADSIEAGFAPFLRSVDIDSQSAMERPAGSETESSPD